MISPTQRLLLDDTHHSLETDINDTGGIRTRDPSERVAVPLRVTGQWDGLVNVYIRNKESNDEVKNLKLQIAVLRDLKGYFNVGRYGW